jgi:hypothetical protein
MRAVENLGPPDRTLSHPGSSAIVIAVNLRALAWSIKNRNTIPSRETWRQRRRIADSSRCSKRTAQRSSLDSPMEQAGFELVVPRRESPRALASIPTQRNR